MGAVIVNSEGLVLVGRRRGLAEAAWQFPQGGLDEGDSPEEAVYREIREEFGIERANLKLLAASSAWLTYELPEGMRSEKTGSGQSQRWFCLRFTGEDVVPDENEFAAYQWRPFQEVVKQVVAFRRQIYETVAEEFADHLR